MRVLLGAMCALGAGLLVGCGSSSSTASTAPSTQAATTATAAATTKSTATVAPHTEARSGSASSSPKGGAASFRVAHGDNSIPGFGGEASTSERQRATAALAGFLRARAHGEWAKVCTYLTGTIRREMEGFAKSATAKTKGCGAALGALQRGSAAERADPLTGGVVAVRVKGKSAFVLFVGPHGSKYVMPMQNEGGGWKVTQTAPLAYPLGTPAANP
jgi:hypothetical protein